MMPAIKVSDDTFAKLQRLAKPLIDTPDAVIARLADAALEGMGHGGDTSKASALADVLELPANHPPDLTHTRVLYAAFDQEEVPKPNWNEVVREAHVATRERLGSFEAVRKVSDANIREDRYEEHGFRYLAKADFSIQGGDSNQSWQTLLRLAKALKVPVEVVFEWRDKEAAAHPGDRGRLAWSPEAN